MIRPQSRQLRIGWITPTVGTFGAVREMVEVSNVLINRGHTVYIYHPDGLPCKWLRSSAIYRKLAFIEQEPLDVLIGILDWQPELYKHLLAAEARVKAICLLGFNPTEEMAQALRGETSYADNAQKMISDAMRRNFMILADSSWQVEWVKEKLNYPAGPAFGGINLSMFYPALQSENKKIKIIYSGDPRERKGTDVVEKAIELLKIYPDIEFGFYWNRRFTQQQLVEFIQGGDIFLDAHRRAGWCNPVAEAIACGVVPVCTDIGAVQDFARHEQTALVVPVDDHQAMAEAAIRLVEDPDLRKKLRENGLRLIRKFSYDHVVPVLESALVDKVYVRA